jgi:DNA (cytosine-5)-methyltransferase 1
LQDVVKWPTPNARDWKDTTAKSSIAAINGGHQMTLGRAVHYPTPYASDNRDRGHIGMPSIQRRVSKGKQIMLSMSVSDTSGALNPLWVEWLMGWPLGWTDLKPLEMDKFQQWLVSHGKHLAEDQSK